jgi:hypothetical protein
LTGTIPLEIGSLTSLRKFLLLVLLLIQASLLISKPYALYIPIYSYFGS